jgi:hypothetical protein
MRRSAQVSPNPAPALQPGQGDRLLLLQLADTLLEPLHQPIGNIIEDRGGAAADTGQPGPTSLP